MVISFETIEHLPNIDKYLEEISRVLKPGGEFIVSTPDRRLSSVLYPFTRKPSHPFHIKEFTYQEFFLHYKKTLI
jgi:ubiquinone/menaquinone biosynthesis C-methylase UbiE